MKVLWLTVFPLQLATIALSANTCTSELHKDVLDNKFDRWWATASCTELNPGCSFRAVLDIAGSFDVRSGFTNEINKVMTTGTAEKIYGYRDPLSKAEVEC